MVYLEFLRLIIGTVVLVWILNLIFKFGGSMAPLLTVIAPVLFVAIMTLGRNKRAR